MKKKDFIEQYDLVPHGLQRAKFLYDRLRTGLIRANDLRRISDEGIIVYKNFTKEEKSNIKKYKP